MFVTIIESENLQTLKLIEKCSKETNCYECKFFKTNENCLLQLTQKKLKINNRYYYFTIFSYIANLIAQKLIQKIDIMFELICSHKIYSISCIIIFTLFIKIEIEIKLI